MDSAERGRIIAEKKEQYTSGLDAHIVALEELTTTTSFDFDVATDVHPHLLFDTEAGKAQLKKWQELYAALADGPRSMVTLRWSSGMKPGCYGFGAKPEYETKAAWVHVYEKVSMDDIVFVKGDEDTPSSVIISEPHQALFINSVHMRLQESRPDDAVLYEPAPTAGYQWQHELTNTYPKESLAHEEAFGFGETISKAYSSIDALIDNKLSLGAAMSVSDFASKRIREQKHSNTKIV
jgi:hypothetical protein